jgi:pimeloyl-ACP methyl ester carboxylesterase
MAATIVFVHGAWHGGWCWDAVRSQLDATGVASVTVDLPSVRRADATLTDDGDEVRRVLDAIDDDIVLVGHSYGGAVVTDAGVHPRVTQLVYLTAFALDDGESVNRNALEGGETMTLGDALVVAGDGTVTVDPERAIDFFFHDCAPHVAASAVAQLRPMSLNAMGGMPRAVAWRERPAMYVVCTDDHALPVALQESSARRVGASVDIATSHSPFLSAPGTVVDLLVPLAR